MPTANKLLQLSLLLVTALAATPQQPDEVRCVYSQRFVCDSQECRAVSTGSLYLLMPDVESLRRLEQSHSIVQIRRCDSRGCTPVQTIPVMSGVFLNLVAPANGYLLKVNMTTVEFVEMATLMLDVYGGRGACNAR